MMVDPVIDITVNAQVDGKLMATYTGLEVGKTPITGQYRYVREEYPNALSAVISLPDNEDKTKSDNVVTAVGLFPDETGYTEYITTLTMEKEGVETTYPNIEGQYWTYTVTHVVGQDAEGKDIVETYPMSEIVGLGTFQLHTGDTINLICDYYNAE